uniref:Peroxisomal membrane protein PEX14 n=1 Tax=Ditylenchus dipsaci TaxID=166011 RepID=A0A915EK80_9BILA
MSSDAQKEYTPTGNPEAPPLHVILRWNDCAWKEISRKTIVKSFEDDKMNDLSSELQPTSSTSNVSNIRPEMVNSARQFLLNDKVRQTPLEEQKSFLREKGLSEQEIQEAFNTISPAVGLTYSQNTNEGFIQQQPMEDTNRFTKAIQSAVIVGGVGYVGYKFIRSWLLPRFFNIPDPAQERVDALQTQMNELQNSTKFIMDSVVQTLETVSAQQEQLNRALVLMSAGSNFNKENDFERLHTDIGIVKSLLLNQNQFPAIPNHNSTKPMRGPGRQFNVESSNGGSSFSALETNGLTEQNGHNDSSV